MDTPIEIIIVDDNREQARQIADALTRSGARVTVRDEPAALMLDVDRQLPDLVLYDCPALTGSFLKSLKYMKLKILRTPVLVYTDRFREITRVRSIEMGADDVVAIEGLMQGVEGICEVLKPRLRGDAGGSTAGRATVRGQMYLRLNAGELSNALQFLCAGGRVGQLVLTFPDEEKAHVFLDSNTVVHVEFRGRTGLDAMALIISNPREVEAHFHVGNRPAQVTNDRPISQFLIEASVQADEMNAQ